MTAKKKKPLPAFGLDMPFDEALARFIRTDPKEVEQSIQRSKKKKPPDRKRKRKPPGGTFQSETIVDLRHRRMRKRNQRP
jgi:hypothetical protein